MARWQARVQLTFLFPTAASKPKAPDKQGDDSGSAAFGGARAVWGSVRGQSPDLAVVAEVAVLDADARAIVAAAG